LGNRRTKPTNSGSAAGVQPRVAAPQRRVSCEGQLPLQREDADPVIGFRRRRGEEERGLREVEPARDPLHRLGGEIVGVEDDGEGVAGERRLGEHVDQLEAPVHGRPPRVSAETS
jgi:hypothetical protein